MSIYEKEYKIQSSDVDMFRRLRLSRLFTFTQEAAIHHTEELGAGREKTLDRGFLWVVTMQHAEIARLPEYDEHIKLVSWAGKTMHVMFPRFYEIYDESGECIIKGSAIWMLMDMNTRSMIFPDAQGIGVEGTVLGREYPLPKPIKPMETERNAEFTVPFSYADINGHLTNTKYFDIAEDMTALSCNNKTPNYVACEYSGEAKYGDCFDISVFENENTAYLSGSGENNKKIFKLLMKY
jgi:medium-chain acyl-[acyl-carrier-protein] hydrolase